MANNQHCYCNLCGGLAANALLPDTRYDGGNHACISGLPPHYVAPPSQFLVPNWQNQGPPQHQSFNQSPHTAFSGSLAPSNAQQGLFADQSNSAPYFMPPILGNADPQLRFDQPTEGSFGNTRPWINTQYGSPGNATDYEPSLPYEYVAQPGTAVPQPRFDSPIWRASDDGLMTGQQAYGQPRSSRNVAARQTQLPNERLWSSSNEAVPPPTPKERRPGSSLAIAPRPISTAAAQTRSYSTGDTYSNPGIGSLSGDNGSQRNAQQHRVAPQPGPTNPNLTHELRPSRRQRSGSGNANKSTAQKVMQRRKPNSSKAAVQPELKKSKAKRQPGLSPETCAALDLGQQFPRIREVEKHPMRTRFVTPEPPDATDVSPPPPTSTPSNRSSCMTERRAWSRRIWAPTPFYQKTPSGPPSNSEF